jgi:hypothetical protein
MAEVWQGSSLEEQPATQTRKRGEGVNTTRTWFGKESDIVAKENEMYVLGYQTEITSGGGDGSPKWVLRATKEVAALSDPDNEEPEEPEPVWSLHPHVSVQSIFEIDRPLINDMDYQTRTRIEAKLKNPERYTLEFVDHLASYTDDQYHNLQNQAARVYHYKNLGIDGKEFITLTLRRSIVVPNTFRSLTWSVANVGKVLSTTRLLANVEPFPPPECYVSILPASVYENKEVYVEGYFADVAGQMIIPGYWGWLERYPTADEVGAGKIQISQEWTYNKWLVGDDGFYDVVE